jgi:hypothetical protein
MQTVTQLFPWRNAWIHAVISCYGFAGLSNGCAKEGMQCLKSVGENKNIVMDAPYFYQKLSEALGNYTADYWVPYMRLHVIYNLSPLLNGKLILTCIL